MAPKREYIECECTSTEHSLRLTWWDEDDPKDAEIFVDVFLNQYYGFWKRLWLGIKYVFGYKSKYGHFDEAIWRHSQVKQVRDLCERWLEAYPLSGKQDDPDEVIRIAQLVVDRKRKVFMKAVGNLEDLQQARKEELDKPSSS